MEHSEEAIGDPAVTVGSQEVLEEMIWFFRVEDASPWNYSILVLAAVVVVISFVLLGRSIQAKRNPKMQPQEKETPEVLYLQKAETKESNSLNNLTETLLSETPSSAQVGTEIKEKSDPPENDS